MTPNSSLPDILRRILFEKRTFLPDGSAGELHSNVSLEEAATLHSVVRTIKPSVSVEIGFAQGISALAILDALEKNGKGVHHVIDPFQDRFGNVGLSHVKLAGLEGRFKFYQKFAEEVIPTLPRLQFAFIDSSHLFDLTMCEFVLTDKRLDVGGLVGFHDMWMPSQQRFIRYVLANRAYKVWHHGEKNSDAADKAGLMASAKRAVLNSVPGKERLFNAGQLQPWNSFGISNLVFLEKLGEDNRDWQFHADF